MKGHAREERVLLFVGTRKGGYVYESDYERLSWKRTGPFLGPGEVVDLTWDWREGSSVYAATGSDGVWRSQDLGRHWERLGKLPKGVQGRVLTLGAQPGELLLLCAPGSFARSDDGGASWKQVSKLPVAKDAELRSLLAHASDASALYAAVNGHGVLLSEDAGESWQPSNQGIDSDLRVQRLVSNPARPDTLFAALAEGIYRSQDSGDSWHRLNGGPHTRDLAGPLALSPARPSSLYLVPSHASTLAVLHSRDSGESWDPWSEGLGEGDASAVAPDALALDDCDEEGAYLGTAEGTVFVRHEDADGWEQLGQGLPPVLTVEPVVLLP